MTESVKCHYFYSFALDISFNDSLAVFSDSQGILRMTSLAKRKLLDLIKQRTERARKSGELQTIFSDRKIIEDKQLQFSVMVKKADVKTERPVNLSSSPGSTNSDPFLPPYAPDLHVEEWQPASVSPSSYALLLNKFNVMNWHVLIVTTTFVSQFTALTNDDLLVLYEVVSELKCLGFYNAGKEAGPSQPHRHLQIVPLEDNYLPFFNIISDTCEKKEPSEVFSIEEFEFHHAICRIPSSGVTGEIIQKLYQNTPSYKYNFSSISR